MKYTVALLGSFALATPAMAQEITLKPIAEARFRDENVDQAGIAAQSEAFTIRMRAGVQAISGALRATVVAQGNLAVDSDYYDGLHGAATRPLVSDPQNIALYLAHVQYKTKAITLTAGRQRIALDDERFVGSMPFRQNGQTFDAVRMEWPIVPKLNVDLTYAWRVNTIWGIDGSGARPRSIGGNNVFANIGYATPIGTITGFSYLVDQDEAAVQGYRLSSQTYGARLAGAQALSTSVKLSYQLSYASQSAYDRNPNRYRAAYYLIDTGLDIHAARVGGGYEVLGADNGMALTSFQAPLGTGFRFQGWDGKFAPTPPDGVRDLYGSLSYCWAVAGPLKALTVQGVYHRFASDRLTRLYGDEVDLLASAKLHKTTLAVRYASYHASSFATDTRKFWLQMDWSL